MFRNIPELGTFGIRDTHPVSPSESLAGLGQGTMLVSLHLRQSPAAAGVEGITWLRGSHLVRVLLAARSGQR